MNSAKLAYFFGKRYPSGAVYTNSCASGNVFALKSAPVYLLRMIWRYARGCASGSCPASAIAASLRASLNRLLKHGLQTDRFFFALCDWGSQHLQWLQCIFFWSTAITHHKAYHRVFPAQLATLTHIHDYAYVWHNALYTRQLVLRDWK